MAMKLMTAVLFLSSLFNVLMAHSEDYLNERVGGLAASMEKMDNKLEFIVTSILSDDLMSGHLNKDTCVTVDECYKGMSSLNKPPRTLVTIPGNRTALCDTITDGGGWIVFQRRADGEEDFFRGWEDYKAGFGDIAGGGDYWLGNEIIHQLTWMGTFELRVDMHHQGKKYYAHYSSFYLGDENTKYTLHIGNYNGDAGNHLGPHNGKKFSTFDMDSDDDNPGNCAVKCHGGWWYMSCYLSHLNVYGEPLIIQATTGLGMA